MSPRAVVVVAACAMVLTACGKENDGRETVAPREYVALGDSYTSAHGVPETIDEGCLRSNRNYPSLLADDLDLKLTDVSCAGAATTALVGVQQTATGLAPPQFQALSAATDLVTLGIGGNDETLFQTLFVICTTLDQGRTSGSPCRDQMTEGGTDQLLEIVDKVRERVTSALVGITQRAPNAEVFLVGYPQLVPERGQCDGLQLTPGDYDYVHEIMVALGKATERAAADAEVRYIDVLKASAGHDVCAGPDAWINGSTPDPDRPAAGLHPFAEEQAAVAELLAAALEDEDAS